MLQEKLAQRGDAQCCPIAVIISDSKILLGVRNYTPDKWKDITVWTMPGGRCDVGETLEQTLRREVQEEVNITELEIHEYIGEVPGAKEGDKVFIFDCTTDQDCELMEPEKFSEWCWVPVQDYVADESYGTMNLAMHRLVSQYIRKEFSL